MRMKKTILPLFTFCFSLAGLQGSAQELEWVTPTIDSGYSIAYGVAVDGSGNVYTAGIFRDTVDFDPGPGTAILADDLHQGFVQKVDASGNFQFVKGFFAATQLEILDLVIDSNGDLIITGRNLGVMDADPGPGVYNLPGSTNFFGFIIRLNSSGDLIWAHSFVNGHPNNLVIDNESNLYITGDFYDFMDLDPGAGSVPVYAGGFDHGFVIKLDQGGNFKWGKQINSNNTSTMYDAAVDPDGNVYVSGIFAGMVNFPDIPLTYTAGGTFDAIIWKIDSTGQSLWVKPFESTDMQRPYTLVAGENQLFVAGTFNGSMDIDLGAGTQIMTAGTESGEDFFLTKMTGNGDHVWSRMLKGTSLLYTREILLAANGDIYVAGDYNGQMDTDLGPAEDYISNPLGRDGYIIRTDNDGNAIWSRVIGGEGMLAINDITLGAGNELYLAGFNYYTVDFAPGPEEHIVTHVNDLAHAYVAKWHQQTVSVKEKAPDKYNVMLYPNPTNGNITLDLGNVLGTSDVAITDLTGKIISKRTFASAGKVSMNVEGPAGVYFVSVNNSGSAVTKKLVKQ